ncbi:ribosome small subunit-dependent GTPase A [Tamlana sp. 2201CG12-4]|uniref:ribosome small subunit-dependent GTPase A n=1 Tax=Tamlana sp. 2201CG12-4 TaxID=3112582 RepID=UPI002DBC4E74|nr:ribosome small subunit-dependent GTPase A [Tamlana sp. 2201CG12-4]MEC3905604.1 ribosome small subunit-dependent GTPase A [Tamlana sp. 2201CG12-4]
MTGKVYKSTGSWYTVKTDLGHTYECRIKGKFRIKGIKSTNPIAVGDIVDFELETNNNQESGIIYNIHDRTNCIVRKSVNLSKQTHIIAANLDQVFLMVTINNPPTLTSFIDRFLVTAEAYSIKTILLFNKIDSYDDEALDEVKYLAYVYRKIGYECIGISATTGKNVDKVKALMHGKVSMFSGHSGVGKSTLVNTIEPTLNIKTKAISTLHMQGQHTTTFAEMFDLSFNAKIIDTPGIKGFGVVDMDKEEVGDYFPEIFRLKQDCKFNNCLHIQEPKCAVKNALDDDEVAFSRYRSYLQIIEGEDEHYRTDIWDKE